MNKTLEIGNTRLTNTYTDNYWRWIHIKNVRARALSPCWMRYSKIPGLGYVNLSTLLKNVSFVLFSFNFIGIPPALRRLTSKVRTILAEIRSRGIPCENRRGSGCLTCCLPVYARSISAMILQSDYGICLGIFKAYFGSLRPPVLLSTNLRTFCDKTVQFQNSTEGAELHFFVS